MDKTASETLLKLVDQNLAHSIKHRITNSRKGKIHETESYIIYTIGEDNEDGHINGVLCFDDYCAEELFEKAHNFFNSISRNYVYWIRNHKDSCLEEMLKKRGFRAKRNPGSAGMIIKNRVKQKAPSDEVEVRKVGTIEDIHNVSTVIQDAFSKSAAVGQEMFSSKKILISPDAMAYVLYHKKRPVATACITLSGIIAGLYYVATVKDAQKQGFGGYITQIATNACFDAGAHAVALQASETGELVYKKLGYQTITHYRWYTVPFLS